MSLLEIQNDPDYVNANAATKQAIFDAYSKDDPDYTGANSATQAAIRESFGLSSSTAAPKKAPAETTGLDYAGPQMASIAREVAATAPEAYQVGKDLVKAGASNVIDYVKKRPLVQSAADVAGMATHGVPWGTIARQAIDPNAMTIGEALGHAGNALKHGAGAVGQAARGLGSAVVQGAIAPENLFLAPYQMSAYEQEKIRANPTAPEYKTTPYAQAYRGEYATQGQAAAANRRNAIAGQQYGGLSAEEQAILAQDRARQLAPARNAIQGASQPNNWMTQALDMANRYRDVPRY